MIFKIYLFINIIINYKIYFNFYNYPIKIYLIHHDLNELFMELIFIKFNLNKEYSYYIYNI